MQRREFNLLALAGLATTALPEIVEASASPVKRDPLKFLRTYVAAVGGQHIYLTGRSVPKSTSAPVFGVSGVIVMAAGVLDCGGQEKLYHLGHSCYNALTEGDKIREAFARYELAWAPVERFYEAGGMLEPLLDRPPYPTRVSQIAAKAEDEPVDLDDAVLADAVKPFKVIKFNWHVVGAVEPHNGNTFRKIFPTRLVHEDLTGERLEVMQAAQTLADIHRRFLKSNIGRVGTA
jgi:hypothetical protein